MTDKTFIVTMECVVTKSVTCRAESEEEIRKDPWEYAIEEFETEQIDWQIIRIKQEG